MQVAFDFQPTLRGPRITIRPIAADDWDELFEAASDPKIWEQHPARDRYREPVFREYFDEAIESGSAFVFVDRACDRIVGSSRYDGHDPVTREIEIGWTFLTRAYWGGSYNREIKQLMLQHAFRFVETVVLWVGVANLRSQLATQKIGGVLRDGIHARDQDQDNPHVIFEVRRENWHEAQLGTARAYEE